MLVVEAIDTLVREARDIHSQSLLNVDFAYSPGSTYAAQVHQAIGAIGGLLMAIEAINQVEMPETTTFTDASLLT